MSLEYALVSANYRVSMLFAVAPQMYGRIIIWYTL